MCEWGADGARHRPADVAIVVDVLSFSTCVSVAVDRGACIFPFLYGHAKARAFADAIGAKCAARRGEGGFSLSPSSMNRVAPGQRIVLPSPNGAALSLAQTAPVVLAGCLRNAGAVARAALRLGSRILVAAAGERWPNGGLRVGFEDLAGAGAINSSATVPILRADTVRYDEIMAVETDAVGAPLKDRQVVFYDAMAEEATAPI